MRPTVFASIVIFTVGASVAIVVTLALYHYHYESPAQGEANSVTSATADVSLDRLLTPEANDAYWIKSIKMAEAVNREMPALDVPDEFVALSEKLYDLGALEVWFRETNGMIELTTRLPRDPLARHAVIDCLVAAAEPATHGRQQERGVGWDFYGITIRPRDHD